MGAEPVVPVAVAIESTLDSGGCQRQPRPFRPLLHIAEDPLGLRIQMPVADLAADMRQAEPSDSASELGPELAAVICCGASRRYPTLLRGLPDQLDEITQGRPVTKDMQCADAAAEAIDDCRDPEALAEHSMIGDVEMPDLVRLGRVLNMLRCLRGARATYSVVRSLGKLLLKHTSDRRPADLDVGSDDVPRDCAGSELWLREGHSHLVHEQADAVADPVPSRAPEHLFNSQFVLNSLLPVPDRVGMHNDPLSSFLGRPSAQLHDLEDLSPRQWCVVRSLMTRLPMALGSEGFEFPFEQGRIMPSRVSLPHHPHHRRGVIQHPGPCEDRRTHEGRSDSIRHGPWRPLQLRHVDSPTTVVRPLQPDILNHCASMHLRPSHLLRTGHIGHRKRDPQIRWPTAHRVAGRAPGLTGRSRREMLNDKGRLMAA